VETDAVASGNESDGLFADRSMGGGGAIERRWSGGGNQLRNGCFWAMLTRTLLAECFW
jgi:hypothetical protein